MMNNMIIRQRFLVSLLPNKNVFPYVATLGGSRVVGHPYHLKEVRATSTRASYNVLLTRQDTTLVGFPPIAAIAMATYFCLRYFLTPAFWASIVEGLMAARALHRFANSTARLPLMIAIITGYHKDIITY